MKRDLYEKAFNTKVDTESIDYMSDGRKIAHAIMKIHGIEVYLNDALKFLNDTYGMNCGAHLIITFNSVDELLICYEILKSNDKPSPFYETPYSKLVGNFKDKIGVLWGFMVTA
jgi:uncharacterized glyoxalase superfamily protein PhnB